MKDGLAPVSDNDPWLDPRAPGPGCFHEGWNMCLCALVWVPGGGLNWEHLWSVPSLILSQLHETSAKTLKEGFTGLRGPAGIDVRNSQWNFSNCCYKLICTEQQLCPHTKLNALSYVTISYDSCKINILSNLSFLYLLIINLMWYLILCVNLTRSQGAHIFNHHCYECFCEIIFG